MADNDGNEANHADVGHNEDDAEVEINEMMKTLGNCNLYHVSPSTARSRFAVIFKTNGRKKQKIDKINTDERAIRQRTTDMLFKV